MTIGSVGGVLSRAPSVRNQSSQAPESSESESSSETAAEEATETDATTKKEAARGDVRAQQKLAREPTVVDASQSGEAAANIEGKGTVVSAVA